jgi:hypothetical protein
MKHEKTHSRSNRDAVPFQVTRADLLRKFASPRLVQQMIAAGWLTVVRKGKPGRETLFDYESAVLAYDRLKRGEEPPLLPCETKYRAKTPTTT